MKTYKNLLTVLLSIQMTLVVLSGNATLAQLAVISATMTVTAFFRIYYRESWMHFTNFFKA